MGRNQPDPGLFDIVIYYIISKLVFLLGKIPRKTAFRLAGLLGRLWFAVDRRHRNVAVDNLTMVYGDRMSPAEIRRFARRVFCNLSMIVFEIGWSLHLNEARIRRYIRFEGMHHLVEATKKGRGVVVLTAHIGNWELLVAVAGMTGMPVSAVYRPFDFKPLDMFFADIRSRFNTKIYPKKNVMRKAMRSLKNNEMVGILLDQNTKASSGVFVDFFGRPACTSLGAAFLAKRMKSPVIPAFLVRDGDFYRVLFGPEVQFILTGDKKRDIEENTRLYNRVIESVILRYPEQWFWVHRRWKTRPPRASAFKSEKPAGLINA